MKDFLLSEFAFQSMEIVYDLEQDLEEDPEQVQLAQALSLNESKPFLGLKGNMGLFGSKSWWDAIRCKKIPHNIYYGKIVKTMVLGQSMSMSHNGIEMISDDGVIRQESMYANDLMHLEEYKVGNLVGIYYVYDELKVQPDRNGDVNRLEIVIGVAVSTKNVTN